MPDEQPNVQLEAPVLTDEQAAWKQQMDYQFSNDAPTIQNNAAPAIDENVAAIDNQPPANLPDYTPFIKETFGLESVDDVKSQWQELQALKANPPKAEAITFENDESKRLHELVRTGKFKEANEIINQQLSIERLTTSEVNDETADEIIKLGMKFENSELTQKEIDFKFKKLYAVPKEPVQAMNEDDPEFEIRHNEWLEQVEDVKMSKTIDAKTTKPKLEAAKAKIQFPDILSQQGNVDAEYEAYKARNANVSEQIDTTISPAIKSLKESDVQLGFKVNDQNNQMEFDVSLAPTPEAFEKARQDSLNFEGWFQNLCWGADGKFQPQNVQRLILLNDNYGKYAESIARQAVNAERSRVIAKETGNDGNNGKNYNVNVGERTELQKQMDARLS